MRSESDSGGELARSDSHATGQTRAQNPLREVREDQGDLTPSMLRGALVSEGVELPVVISVASNNSLYAAFPFGGEPPSSAVFESLVLQLGESRVTLSRCRFDPAERQGAFAGTIVFLNDVFDCKALVLERKVVSTRNAFQNLALVMAKKDSVRPEFRSYAVDLIYELSAYKKFFDEQDELLAGEPAAVRKAAREALRRGEGRAFFDAFDKRLAALDELIQYFNKDDYERHGYYLRRVSWEFIRSSEFLRRTNLKPRGYAGDADMMMMAYRNEYLGDTVFGQLMHKHPLETPAAEAVRARRFVVADAIAAARKQAPSSRLRVLSIASGPAAELVDIYRTPED